MLSNAQIAQKLMAFAQLLALDPANRYKVKAYRRAAKTIQALGESIDDLVREETDLTGYPGIGKAISAALKEIVETDTMRQFEALQSQIKPELVEMADYPNLDPARVLRIYKALEISSLAALKENLASGAVAKKLGARMDQHVRRALGESQDMLLYDADRIAGAVENFLIEQCRITRAEAAGDYRRRVEVVSDISFLVESDDFRGVLSKLEHYGGKADLISADEDSGVFKLSSGVILRVERAPKAKWGIHWIASTGSEDHLRKLDLKALITSRRSYPTEGSVYKKLGLGFIPPELREGNDEIELAAQGKAPDLVSARDIRGELHAHTVSSDGTNTIAQMMAAAQKRGHEYIGISDHSQSLKIAGGLSEKDLWAQIRFIDKLNEGSAGIRVLKSAEVDILADGSLDYPDELLKELDYTICSIHSRFGLGKAEQTARILRAMDNRYFNVLGHATGRLLLKRPGYEIDIDRIVAQARQNGCFFEINSSPDRLDLSAENARIARDAGVKIAVTTDAHSIRDFDFVRYGIDQARRAGLPTQSILNALPWPELQRVMKR